MQPYLSDLAKALACAMARQEGWLNPHSVQHANNNPGNMMDLNHFKATRQFQLAKYPTPRDGWDAMASLIQRTALAQNLTLREFIGGAPGKYSGYAPLGHGGNNPAIYATNVARWLGIDADTPLDQYVNVTLTTAGLPRYGAEKATDVQVA